MALQSFRIKLLATRAAALDLNTRDLKNAEADEAVTWDFGGLLETGRAPW
jgi:hypothetical protein